MKRSIVTILVGLVITGATSQALAQTETYIRRPHRITVWMDGGLAIPSQPSEFSDLWNTTWPFSGGVGLSIFSWLEVAGGVKYGSFGISEIPAKSAIGLVSTAAIDGGSIAILEYYGTARFIAVPSQRVNPYAEVSVGAFRITGEDLEVEATDSGPEPIPGFTNTMEDVDGIHVSVGAGIQYALDEYWTAYSTFTWNLNLNDDFAPRSLVQRASRDAEITSDSMQYGLVSVGIMIRL
jgi:hypothetical protein